MTQLRLGDRVVLATSNEMHFEVVQENLDGSFEIEAKMSTDQVIRYSSVVKEMIKLVE